MGEHAQGGARSDHDRERSRRREILGQEFLRYRRAGRDRARQGGQLRAQPLCRSARRARALEKSGGRAAVERMDHQDGEQGAQGGARDSQQRDRVAEELNRPLCPSFAVTLRWPPKAALEGWRPVNYCDSAAVILRASLPSHLRMTIVVCCCPGRNCRASPRKTSVVV